MPARKKSKRRLQARQGFNQVAALWLAGITVAVGVSVVLFTHAAGSGKLYIDPSSVQVAAGSTVQVTVREDSGATPVNAVQADVTYPTSTLDYIGSDGTGSAFGVEAPTNTSGGVVSFTRGSITPLTGDQPVVKLTFRVKSGSSVVNLRNTSALVSSGSNANILGSMDSATISELTQASPTPTPTDAVTPSPTPVTATSTPVPTTTSTPAPTSTDTSSNSNSSADTVTLPAVSGTPSGSTTTYEVDGKAITGNTVDGSQLSNGTHTVTTTTTDANGNVVKKTTTTVAVNTKKSFWQNAFLVMKENVPAIILVTLLVVVGIGGFIFYRRNISGNTNTLAWPT